MDSNGDALVSQVPTDESLLAFVTGTWDISSQILIGLVKRGILTPDDGREIIAEAMAGAINGAAMLPGQSPEKQEEFARKCISVIEALLAHPVFLSVPDSQWGPS